MKELLKQMFSDVDDKGSSKRLVFLWVAIVVWSFIHIMVFYGIKPFPIDTANTLIMYDVILIFSLAGMALSEKIWGREIKTTVEKKEINLNADQPPTK